MKNKTFNILLSIFIINIFIIFSMVNVDAGNNTKYSSSINFYGEKTDVYLGEDIITKLSIVNLI